MKTPPLVAKDGPRFLGAKGASMLLLSVSGPGKSLGGCVNQINQHAWLKMPPPVLLQRANEFFVEPIAQIFHQLTLKDFDPIFFLNFLLPDTFSGV